MHDREDRADRADRQTDTVITKSGLGMRLVVHRCNKSRLIPRLIPRLLGTEMQSLYL